MRRFTSSRRCSLDRNAAPLAEQSVAESPATGDHAQLKSNAVTAAKIASNAVTSAKIASNTVNSAKVQDGTLVKADFRPASS
jgi:hypothetical protein